MATQEVLDAVVVPQSQGTGLGSEDDMIDAASAALMSEYVGGDDYVGGGMGFQNLDGTNNTFDVAPGYCFITDDSTSTGGERGSGGNAQVQSTTSSGYDTELPSTQVYLVIFPTAVTISVSDDTFTNFWVNITDVTSNNAVEVRSDSGGGTTATPSDTFLDIGAGNVDTDFTTLRNRSPSVPWLDGTTTSDTTTLGQNAGSASDGVAIGNDANATGNNSNAAVGSSADAQGWRNVALGHSADANNNSRSVVIGENANVTANRAVALGQGTSVATANVGRIGVDQLVFGGVQDTIADADLNNEELTVEADEGNSQFVLRYKDSNGTVQTATVAFS